MTPITLFAFRRPGPLQQRLRALMPILLLLATTTAPAKAYWNLNKLRWLALAATFTGDTTYRLKGSYHDFVPIDERQTPKASAGNFLK